MTPSNCLKSIIVVVLLLLIVFAACAPKTEEDRIREMMKEAGRRIENKDISGLLIFLSEDYTDYRGRNKIQTEDMVKTYFQEFRGIVIHLLGTKIDEMEQGTARIRTDAAISSGAAKALRKLVPVSTDNYRFKIELVKQQDQWLIRYAEWRYIGVEKLFPESLPLFKKLFSENEVPK